MVTTRSFAKADYGFWPGLRVVDVKCSEHLLFNFCDFNFFRGSAGGSYLFFGSSKHLVLLIAVPYILACEVVFLRGRRFFVKLKDHVAGVFIVRSRAESLYVSSLAVAPQYRRLGLGMFILQFAENVAADAGRKWLELSVLKTNWPARRLYEKAGFKVFKEKQRSLTLRKRVA